VHWGVRPDSEELVAHCYFEALSRVAANCRECHLVRLERPVVESKQARRQSVDAFVID
jgi:hypothetical protein